MEFDSRLSRLNVLVGIASAACGAALLLFACSSDPVSYATISTPSEDGGGGGATLDVQVLDASLDGARDDADAAPQSCFGDTFDGGAALDDGGALDCTLSAVCTPLCEHVVAHYRAGVAQDAVRCMRALPTCTETLDVMLCVDKALTHACASPTSSSYCAPLLAACVDSTGDAAASTGPFPKAGCETFANGLSPGGRAVFAACVKSTTPGGGCPIGILGCADEIRH